MNIAIIGAGIYGCHLSLVLRKKLGFNVDLYDMAPEIFSGASTHNSHRIHKGYHYPRSGVTRQMCCNDEIRFMSHYSHLVRPANLCPKIFCVAKSQETLIDYITIKSIFHGSKLPFKELTLAELEALGFKNIEGGLLVYEAVLLVDKARQWFQEEIKKNKVRFFPNIFLNSFPLKKENKLCINSQYYDFVVNCTYSQYLNKLSSHHSCYYNICGSLLLASKENIDTKDLYSFGIFDGKFPSLEPYGYDLVIEQYKKRKLFQLYDVELTSLSKHNDILDARKKILAGLSKSEEKAFKEKLMEKTRKYYSLIYDNFNVIDMKLSIKTKVEDLCDARPLIVSSDIESSRLIHVFSSKLTSIFSAEKQLFNLLRLHPAWRG